MKVKDGRKVRSWLLVNISGCFYMGWYHFILCCEGSYSFYHFQALLSCKILNVFIDLLLIFFLPHPTSLFPMVYLTVCAKSFSLLWTKLCWKKQILDGYKSFNEKNCIFGDHKCVWLNGLVTLISIICLLGFCNSLTILLPYLV